MKTLKNVSAAVVSAAVAGESIPRLICEGMALPDWDKVQFLSQVDGGLIARMEKGDITPQSCNVQRSKIARVAGMAPDVLVDALGSGVAGMNVLAGIARKGDAKAQASALAEVLAEKKTKPRGKKAPATTAPATTAPTVVPEWTRETVLTVARDLSAKLSKLTASMEAADSLVSFIAAFDAATKVK